MMLNSDAKAADFVDNVNKDESQAALPVSGC